MEQHAPESGARIRHGIVGGSVVLGPDLAGLEMSRKIRCRVVEECGSQRQRRIAVCGRFLSGGIADRPEESLFDGRSHGNAAPERPVVDLEPLDILPVLEIG
jgi:hypothetical protein